MPLSPWPPQGWLPPAALREGPYANAWFAHHGRDGALTRIEMRSPDYRGFRPGGEKTLFRLPGKLPSSSVSVRHLVVDEAPIDAMSVAAVQRLRADTLYLVTAGGMGPAVRKALERAGEGAYLTIDFPRPKLARNPPPPRFG
jgi:hypothetical protein